LILLEELKQVVEEFTRQGVQTVVLKGGYLAEHVYADIACRPMGDLDIPFVR
jgi:hydroxymethylpyrimidine/phosphomethylpyrimidine kinase